MSNKLRDIFLPHLKWLDKSIIDANPCNTCPTYQEYKIRQQFGPIGEREYAELPDSCPCVKKVLWEGECFSKLKWYESQDKRLHPELLEEPKQPWISVEDRLPEENYKDDLVLAIVSGRCGNMSFHEAYLLAYYSDGVWGLDDYPDVVDLRVHYWMPLPNPPEDK